MLAHGMAAQASHQRKVAKVNHPKDDPERNDASSMMVEPKGKPAKACLVEDHKNAKPAKQVRSIKSTQGREVVGSSMPASINHTQNISKHGGLQNRRGWREVLSLHVSHNGFLCQ